MDYPWVILAEKPVGLSVEESERIAELAERKKACVYVALNRRHYSSTIEAKKLLDEQTGARFIHVMDQQNMDLLRRVGHPEEVVLKTMYANSIHLIDYFSMFGRGDVKQVDVVEPWNPENPGVVIARISFDSGDIGLYHAVWNGPGPWGAAINQGDIRVEMRPLEKVTYQDRGSRKLVDVPVDADDTNFKPGLRHQAISMVKLVRDNSSLSSVTVAEAQPTMRLIGDIYR